MASLGDDEPGCIPGKDQAATTSSDDPNSLREQLRKKLQESQSAPGDDDGQDGCATLLRRFVQLSNRRSKQAPAVLNTLKSACPDDEPGRRRIERGFAGRSYEWCVVFLSFWRSLLAIG